MKFYSLYVTNKCNMDCSYCYRKDKGEECSGGHLISIVNSIMRENQNDDIRIEFLGGEPLLEIEKIFKVCRYITRKHPDRNVSYMITTNGTVVSDRIMEVLKQFGITLIISVDGVEFLHNRHRKFVSGDKTYHHILKNYNKEFSKLDNVGITMTATQDTVSYLFKSFKDIYDKFKCNKINIGLVKKNIQKSTLELFKIKSMEIIIYAIDNNIFIPSFMDDIGINNVETDNDMLDEGVLRTNNTEYDDIKDFIINYYKSKVKYNQLNR